MNRFEQCLSQTLRTFACGIVICVFMSGFGATAEARDKSGVLKASDVIGMKVQGIDGKKLGDIKDLVIDPQDGDIQYAVLDFGGLLGIKDKYFAVPWEALQLDQDNKKLALDVSKKDLKKAPGFDKNNWPDLSQQQVVIYEFYEVPIPEQDNKQSKREAILGK